MAKKTILDSTRYWGVLMKVYMKEIDDSITYKGYIDKIEPIEDWFENRPVVHVVFNHTDKGDLNETIGAEGETYKWFFPLFSYSSDNEERAKTLIENSGGYMQDIKFVDFDSRKDRMEWLLDMKRFGNEE